MELSGEPGSICLTSAWGLARCCEPAWHEALQEGCAEATRWEGRCPHGAGRGCPTRSERDGLDRGWQAAKIARGQADSVTSEGMHVRLAEQPGFGQGDEVAVRIWRSSAGAPTVATTARVGWRSRR